MLSASDILRAQFDAAKPAQLLPPGIYECRVTASRIGRTRNDVSRYALTMDVVTPAVYAGQRLWKDYYLSARAISRTKDELRLIGIDDFEKMERQFPRHVVLAAHVVNRKGEADREFNYVTRLTIARVEPPESQSLDDPDFPPPSPASPKSPPPAPSPASNAAAKPATSKPPTATPAGRVLAPRTPPPPETR
jgi:hypothetical protein